MRKPPFPDMDEILQRLLDGQIESEELERLQKAMREDSRVRDYYIDSMLACAVIRRSSQVTGELSESDLIRAISQDENPGIFKRIMRHRYWIAAVLVFGVLTVALSLFRYGGQEPPIGRLVGDYEAQWQGAGPLPDEPLYAGSYELGEGAAKLELGGGVSILLEAPCQIELTSADEVTLRSGRLVAEVSSQARGFRVRTHTAVITDLGTEFGVIIHSDGSTEAHVLKGSIRVALDPEKSSRPMSLVVHEGQAATVDAAGQGIESGLIAQDGLFLAQLPSLDQPDSQSVRLNLADIVGGGDGRNTGRSEQGIDLGTGQTFSYPATTIRRSRLNEFLTTPQFRGIDGVFVPNGALGPVVISSTGLTFAECPDTMGSFYGGPANSGKIYDIPSRQIHTARLNGVRFGTAGHPALNLHPNAGITFDLDQIRRDNPDIGIERFTAVCGIPKELPTASFSPADVWVLLDGVICLHLRFYTDESIVEKIDVPIPATTRFMTLISTCSGPADYSWVFIGDPFLGPQSE